MVRIKGPWYEVPIPVLSRGYYVCSGNGMKSQLEGQKIEWETVHNVDAAVAVCGESWVVQLEQPW